MSLRLLLAGLLSLAVASPVLAKEYHASRFDARIEVQPGGSLKVTETIVFDFTSGTFRQVFRTIPIRNTDGIEFVSATMDGVALPPGDGPGQVTVRQRNTLRVEWNFSPRSGSAHAFELTYIARGVVRQVEGADLLEWRALPREHDYAIDASRVEIVVPEAPVSPPALERRRIDGSADVNAADGVVVAQATSIRRNGALIVSVALPRGSVLDGPPAWQARQMAQRERMPLWLTVAAAVMLAGFVLLFALRQGYEKPPHDLGVRWESMIPPDSLGPAMAGALVANGQPNLAHAMGSLFALADRGIIGIREEPKGRLGQRVFNLDLLRSDPALAPHERSALDIIYSGAAQPGATVSLASARSRLTRKWSQFKAAVTREMTEAQMIDAGRSASRRRNLKTSIALLFVALVAVVPCAIAAPDQGVWPFFIPLAIAMVALIGLIVMSSQTPLSDSGVRRAEQWRAFRRHLTDPQSIEPRWGAGGTAEARILPFAVALGLAAAWSKFMKKRNVQTPAWFQAASAPDSGVAFATLIASGGASAHGGSPGAGGGGGAAGGGASGAH